jgi:aminopeptidase N
VKRAILDAFGSSKDKERLLNAAKSEKNMDLKIRAMDRLGEFPGNPELWQLYQSETTVEGKDAILRRMWNNGNAEKLLEVVRTEKDPKLRRTALQVLSSQKNAATTDALVQIYNSETDPQIKSSILDGFSATPQHATALIAMARAEKDQKMKLRIVERLANMTGRSKEAADYMAELLK